MEKYFKSFWFWVRIVFITFILFSGFFTTKHHFNSFNKIFFHSIYDPLLLGGFSFVVILVAALVIIKNKDQLPNWRGSLFEKNHMLDFLAWGWFTVGLVEFISNRVMGGSGFNNSVAVLLSGVSFLAGMQLGLKICKIRFREK